MTSTRLGITLGLAAGVVLAMAPAARAQLACGDTVAKGRTVTLTADLGPCDGTSDDSAVIVEGVLDLGGHTVFCGDTSGDGVVPDGIYLRGSKAQVRNGTVRGCDDNVWVGGSGKHTVQGVTATEAADDGFYVATTTAKNRFTGNTSASNGDDGFECRGTKNKIEGNTVNDNGEDGIDLPDAAKNKIVGNTTTGNGDDGIDVNGVNDKSTKNKVLANTSTGNGGYGILVGDSKNKAFGNTATGNLAGDIIGSCANKFKDNTFGSAEPSCVK
jgi:parallel beta-helix repeat protein